MPDCVVDTNVLADVIAQFDPLSTEAKLVPSKFINQTRADILNDIITHGGLKNLIIGSSFAFLEIANKFTAISNGKFDRKKFVTFIRQPPEWFGFENVSLETSSFISQVPKYTTGGQPIELTDAIHVAIALQRGENTTLATTDGKLHSLTGLSIRVI